MNFIISNRKEMERGIRVRSTYSVISIHDPDKPPAKVKRTGGQRDVLYVAFHDAEPVNGFQLPPEIELITDAQAQQMAAFMVDQMRLVKALVVHCEQGMSRSPAVAAAIANALKMDYLRFFKEYQPNLFVYRNVLRAMRSLEDSGGDLSKKQQP